MSKSNSKLSSHPRRSAKATEAKAANSAPNLSQVPQDKVLAKGISRAGRRYPDPLTYNHPWPSMARFAQLLGLRYDIARTRHSYYRQIRLLQEHFDCDPASLTEDQMREYLLHVKLGKGWKPKTLRQCLASFSLFFEEMLGLARWSIFDQMNVKDHDLLPIVLSRDQVRNLLSHIRLRRYRTPIKLIYCCGLRLSECLNLTIHDILGKEGKLFIRNSKGDKDRVVPLPKEMLEDLRRYWSFHRHPTLIFPNVGRGDNDVESVKKRMHVATEPMPPNSLQRLLVVARK